MDKETAYLITTLAISDFGQTINNFVTTCLLINFEQPACWILTTGQWLSIIFGWSFWLLIFLKTCLLFFIRYIKWFIYYTQFVLILGQKTDKTKSWVFPKANRTDSGAVSKTRRYWQPLLLLTELFTRFLCLTWDLA